MNILELLSGCVFNFLVHPLVHRNSRHCSVYYFYAVVTPLGDTVYLWGNLEKSGLKVFKGDKTSCWKTFPNSQWRKKIDNWGGGGGGNIHIFVFTDLKNNRFQKKLIMQNTNI